MGNTVQLKRERGRAAQTLGCTAEAYAEAALFREGWTILARRLRTAAGEIDLVADLDGLTALIEVKARPRLDEAAYALQPRQQARLMAAGEIALANNPGWGGAGVRFDVMLVDRVGTVRRVKDAFRAEAA